MRSKIAVKIFGFLEVAKVFTPVAFAKFTGVLIPVLNEKNILLYIFGFQVSAAQIFAIISIITLTFINYRGIKNGKILQVSFTIAKLCAIIGLIVLGLITASKLNFWTINFSDIWTVSATVLDKNTSMISIHQVSGLAVFSAIGIAMVGSIFSSDAWNNVTFIAGEMKTPKKNIPLSLFWGVLIVTVIYILANIVYLGLLPVKGNPEAIDIVGRGIQFASSDRVGVAAAFQIFGDSPCLICLQKRYVLNWTKFIKAFWRPLQLIGTPLLSNTPKKRFLSKRLMMFLSLWIRQIRIFSLIRNRKSA